ncbi:MAG: MurR/RpiR family transcriptional regulator [Pleomorphochaeta sp.]
MNILEKIQTNYDCHKSSRKKIADYILNNTLDTAFLSLKDFSEKVSTTEVTVLNYCKDLGFVGFNDFRKALQEFIITNYSPSERIYAILKDSKDPSEHYERVSSSELKCIKNSYRMNDSEKLIEALNLIEKDTTIFIVAHEISSICGNYFSYKFSSQGYQCNILDLNDPYSSIAKMQRCEKKVLLAITMKPYSIQTLTFSALAKKDNIPVITFTDSQSSPIVENSNITIFCDTKILEITNSPTSIIAMINQLSAINDLRNKIEKDSNEKPVTDLIKEFKNIKKELELKNLSTS